MPHRPARRRAAAPRRHHHGRQRPLGEAARLAARRRPSQRASRRCGARSAPRSSSAFAYLTLYSFSSENWSRPVDEIDDLMGLMKRFIRRDLAELHQNGVRIRVIGERDQRRDRADGADRRGRRADARQHGAHARHRLQLRLARRDRQGGAAPRRGGAARRRSTPADITPERLGRRSTPPASPIPTC